MQRGHSSQRLVIYAVPSDLIPLARYPSNLKSLYYCNARSLPSGTLFALYSHRFGIRRDRVFGIRVPKEKPNRCYREPAM